MKIGTNFIGALVSTWARSKLPKYKREQDAPWCVPFSGRKVASVLGFLEFIAKDELQEHVREDLRRIYI